ncbi:hypothetical protein HMPREF2851_03670 [Actinomyces sp. HMSC064C12]|nr:hypothetical protein HMPREF2851_03670 [Actinomyces sp. HMSC064C12]
MFTKTCYNLLLEKPPPHRKPIRTKTLPSHTQAALQTCFALKIGLIATAASASKPTNWIPSTTAKETITAFTCTLICAATVGYIARFGIALTALYAAADLWQNPTTPWHYLNATINLTLIVLTTAACCQIIRKRRHNGTPVLQGRKRPK